jgi:hypothetical protein
MTNAVDMRTHAVSPVFIKTSSLKIKKAPLTISWSKDAFVQPHYAKK